MKCFEPLFLFCKLPELSENVRKRNTVLAMEKGNTIYRYKDKMFFFNSTI